MKRIVHLIFLSTVICVKCFAQTNDIQELLRNRVNPEEQALPTNQVIHHINETVNIYDVVSQVKVINDTLTYLYIGGAYRKHKMLIFVTGKEIKNSVNFRVGDKWHFTGKAFIFKRKPAMVLNNSDQLVRV